MSWPGLFWVMVGRTPAPGRPIAGAEELILLARERVQGDPRGPGARPTNSATPIRNAKRAAPRGAAPWRYQSDSF